MSEQKEKRIVLQAKGLRKGYGSGSGRVEGLRGIDLCVYEGELLVILGSSGSGKTTLLNMLGGIDRPDSGALLMDGRDICTLSERGLTAYRRRDVGFVFQFFHLFPELTARENVALIAEFSGHSADTERVLETLGLAGRMDNYPSQLSGGEQQRVAIARALVKRARLVLCDEPTGALDDATGKQILTVLEELVRRHGQTAVMVTHTREIAKMADRVIQMRSGLIEKEWVNPAPTPAEEIEW